MSESLFDRIELLARKHPLMAKAVACFSYYTLPLFPEKNKKLDLLIDEYRDPAKITAGMRRRYKKDLLSSHLVNGISLRQYFIHGFEFLNSKGRERFLGEFFKEYMIELSNDNKDAGAVFKDKYKTYQKFRPFYNRVIIPVEKENIEELHSFAENNEKFVIKVSDGTFGVGVMFYDSNKAEEKPDELFSRLIGDTEKKYIVEELITQAPEMMRLHPSSVNTVRFVTVLQKDDSVRHLFSFLRIGSGGGIIDNASSGGYAAEIDMKTGVVISEACREDLTRLVYHPDTGVKIVGLEIPKWDELLLLVDELARVVKEQKYVGWDLAYTENGWVMVEGNDRAMVTAVQMCRKEGIREAFIQSLN